MTGPVAQMVVPGVAVLLVRDSASGSQISLAGGTIVFMSKDSDPVAPSIPTATR